MNLDDLRQLCGYRPPLRSRPNCQHISFDRRQCQRPAEHECDPGSDGHRPRFVCSSCAIYQVAILGPIVLVADVDVLRIDAEGKFLRIARRTRS